MSNDESVRRETADEFISFARLDWLVTEDSSELHAVREEDWTAQNREDMEDCWGVFSPVQLACGRRVRSLCIPGIFTRMDAMRCAQCCAAMSFPAGKGSPKNDDECRRILGL